MEREYVQEVRSAVYRRDGAKVVAVLRGDVPVELLQLVGDGLVAAVDGEVQGAAPLAERCVMALRDRGWAGDEELAGELEVALGHRPPDQALKVLAVDLEEFSALLEGGAGGGGGVVDRLSGEVWPRPAMEYAQETEEEPPDFEDGDRWLYVGPEGSGEGYRDMEDFIAGVSDPERADRLSIAIEGCGAFWRFKDTVARWPEEQDRWYRFSGERCRGRSREWLAIAGYRAAGGSQGAGPSNGATP
jgi:hypothetical protein